MSTEHISKRWSAAIVAAAGLLVSGATTTADLAQQPASESPRVTVGDDGTVHVPDQVVPMSSFLSPEAKAYVTDHLKAMTAPRGGGGGSNGVPGFMAPYLCDRKRSTQQSGRIRRSPAFMRTCTRRRPVSLQRTETGC